MKRYTMLLATLLAAVAVSAQTHVRIWQGGVSNRVKVENVGDMVFADGNVTIMGQQYAISTIDSIEVVPEINVEYNGTTATVRVPKAIEKDVTVAQDGAHVTITNTNVSNQVELVVRGQSQDGSLTYVGQYKCTFIIDGLKLTSLRGAALDIQCGKRVALEMTDGSVNSLADLTGGIQKGCLYCKGHLEISGNGTLNITGNARHGIATKEYLQIKRSTGAINIVKAASDGIHCGQYFQMNGGTVTIDANTTADGIQAEYVMLSDDVTPDNSKEDNGKIMIKGGTINATIAHEDCKGIKADSDVMLSGGTINILAQGNGSRGIQTDGSVTMSETDAPLSITIQAAGDKCTLDECAADPHKSMCIKMEGNLDINAVTTLNVTATGKKAKLIKVDGTAYLHGNSQYASVLDCLNIIP